MQIILFDHNLYNYAENNTINLIDDSGSAPETLKKVRVRNRPSKNGKIDDELESGTEVRVLFKVVNKATSDEWCYVAWWKKTGRSGQGQYLTGYVDSSFLSDTSLSSPSSYDKLSAFGAETLKYGSFGCEVYNMQLILYYLGYLKSIDDCDGVYASETEPALKRFQQDHVNPLNPVLDPVDGLAGNDTKKAFDYLLKHDDGLMKWFLENFASVPNG